MNTGWDSRRSSVGCGRPKASYAFIRPITGQSWWCLLPPVNTDAMRLALAAFAADEGLDVTHRAVLVLD